MYHSVSGQPTSSQLWHAKIVQVRERRYLAHSVHRAARGNRSGWGAVIFFRGV